MGLAVPKRIREAGEYKPSASLVVSQEASDINERVNTSLGVSIARHKTNLAKRIVPHKGDKARGYAAYEAAWRLALMDAHPSCVHVAWGVKQRALVKHFVNNWVSKEPGDAIELVTWSVLNWSVIMKRQFHWMKRQTPPLLPSLNFFLSMVSHFAACKSEQSFEDWLESGDAPRLQILMARGGMTYEHAMATLQKEKAESNLRQEMRSREIAVAVVAKRAAGDVERALRVAEAGNAPPHPRSALATPVAPPIKGLRHIPDDQLIATIASAPKIDPKRNPFDE